MGVGGIRGWLVEVRASSTGPPTFTATFIPFQGRKGLRLSLRFGPRLGFRLGFGLAFFGFCLSLGFGFRFDLSLTLRLRFCFGLSLKFSVSLGFGFGFGFRLSLLGLRFGLLAFSLGLWGRVGALRLDPSWRLLVRFVLSDPFP